MLSLDTPPTDARYCRQVVEHAGEQILGRWHRVCIWVRDESNLVAHVVTVCGCIFDPRLVKIQGFIPTGERCSGCWGNGQ